MFTTQAAKLTAIAALTVALLAIALAAAGPAPAQDASADLVYTVQPGDTLTTIALTYNLRRADIVLANNLAAMAYLYPGQSLRLPGIPAPSPTPPPTATPAPAPTATPTPAISMTVAAERHTVQPGESVYSIATQYGVPMGSLMLVNSLTHTDELQPGQLLQIPQGDLPTPGPPAPPFAAVTLSEPAIIQGRTLVVAATLTEPATLGGSFEGQPLTFNNGPNGQAWAITAIHALVPPGRYPVILTATRPDGSTVTRVETVEVLEGPYGSEAIVLDAERSALLDAELLAAERNKLLNLWTRVTPRPRWSGAFGLPATGDITSYFGTRRTYNTSEELSFHAGTDFGGFGTPIYAPAAGTVVLAEPLTVRGNAVVIDHGLGLYSGYWHQNELAVVEGQQVQRGDLIGYIGNTGLVTGPHLHWELRLNGIAVNPLQWVQESIP
ncbi:MAG: hypothetical protein Kow0031_01320 [Anaerolineae bacterium]